MSPQVSTSVWSVMASTNVSTSLNFRVVCYVVYQCLYKSHLPCGLLWCLLMSPQVSTSVWSVMLSTNVSTSLIFRVVCYVVYQCLYKSHFPCGLLWCLPMSLQVSFSVWSVMVSTNVSTSLIFRVVCYVVYQCLHKSHFPCGLFLCLPMSLHVSSSEWSFIFLCTDTVKSQRNLICTHPTFSSQAVQVLIDVRITASGRGLGAVRLQLGGVCKRAGLGSGRGLSCDRVALFAADLQHRGSQGTLPLEPCAWNVSTVTCH